MDVKEYKHEQKIMKLCNRAKSNKTKTKRNETKQIVAKWM